MIAGTNDDIQGGICYGGIAHAGPVRYQSAAWFNPGDGIIFPSVAPISKNFTIMFELSENRIGTYSLFWRWGSTYQIRYYSNNYLYLFAGTAPTGFNLLLVDTHLRNGDYKHFAFTAMADETSFLRSCYHEGQLKKSVSSPLPITLVGEGNEANVIISDLSQPLIGSIREIYFYNRCLSAEEVSSFPLDYVSYWKGDENTDAAWRDQKGTAHGVISGSPDPAYIRGDGKIIVNGTIMNP